MIRTMKELNNPLRNTFRIIRKTYEDALYKVILQKFFKGTYAIDELNHKVGVLEAIAIRTAVLRIMLKDMTLACQLRRFRINSKNNSI